jgi:hypothetical protein
VDFALSLLNKENDAKNGVQKSRFIDNDNGTITDTKTGLMWQKEDDSQMRTLQESDEYCKKLTLGGHRDWRLPTIDELVSVAQDWKSIFANTKDDEPYWSNTVLKNPYPQVSEDQKYAAKVLFSDGEVNQFFIVYKYYVRAVRRVM